MQMCLSAFITELQLKAIDLLLLLLNAFPIFIYLVPFIIRTYSYLTLNTYIYIEDSFECSIVQFCILFFVFLYIFFFFFFMKYSGKQSSLKWLY